MTPIAQACVLTVAAGWIALGAVGLVVHRDGRRAALCAALVGLGVAALSTSLDEAASDGASLGTALAAVLTATIVGAFRTDTTRPPADGEGA